VRDRRGVKSLHEKLRASLTAVTAAVSLAACVETQRAREADNDEQILNELVAATGAPATEISLAIAKAHVEGVEGAAIEPRIAAEMRRLQAERQAEQAESDRRAEMKAELDRQVSADMEKLIQAIGARWKRCSVGGDLKIGMSYAEVVKLCARPSRTNTTTTAGHEHDQAVYQWLGGAVSYLYFTDGVLTSVQEIY
jgi:hypothetical protein